MHHSRVIIAFVVFLVIFGGVIGWGIYRVVQSPAKPLQVSVPQRGQLSLDLQADLPSREYVEARGRFLRNIKQRNQKILTVDCRQKGFFEMQKGVYCPS